MQRIHETPAFPVAGIPSNLLKKSQFQPPSPLPAIFFF